MEPNTSEPLPKDSALGSDDLDELEDQLSAADPSEAPDVAERLATRLSDALETTQDSSSTEGDGP